MHYIGIDVQISRGCSYFVINEERYCVDSGWTSKENHDDIASSLRTLAIKWSEGNKEDVAIGIDSPRMPLLRPRNYYWNGKVGWREKKQSDKGVGRHCEVVTKALNIANPQWTPIKGKCPEWMELGFMIFDTLKDFPGVYEVFPSASYTMFQGKDKPSVCVNFSNFLPGPKDMLDACVSAMTVYQFIHNKGSEVGGGDGYGTIILPGKVSMLSAVHSWPE